MFNVRVKSARMLEKLKEYADPTRRPHLKVATIIQPDDDDSSMEIGIFALSEYETYGPLPNAILDAEGFRRKLLGRGFREIYLPQYNENAREEQFQDPELRSWGKDYLWVDNVDFVYYSGHSDENGLKLWMYSPREYHPPDYATYDEVRWGR